ncbi:hypothetical protein [Aureivirga sp. CE67]|uniref:hypothetical protein n=1 Tax=Aureivirga sp. CE67 TaxID=1788983 RepID=UPI0018C9129D|nr:hypothetical protein [Aureivirga sp. CE67]
MIEQEQNNIYNVLSKLQSLIRLLIISLIITIISSIVYLVYVTKSQEKILYGVSEKGDLIPLHKLELKESEMILQKANIDYFLRHFYAFDKYDIQERVQKALYISDGSVEKIYESYLQNGSLVLLDQINSQKINHIEVEIQDDNFYALAKIEQINNDKSIYNSYLLEVKGKIVKTSRNYPLNPFGYKIYDFVEISITKKDTK